jgi:hypothetical protein
VHASVGFASFLAPVSHNSGSAGDSAMTRQEANELAGLFIRPYVANAPNVESIT